MLFNSINFLIFFSIVLFLYYLTKPKYRWLILLASSYIFYMSWKAEYVILLFISTLVSYYVAIYLPKLKNTHKKWLLSFGILFNLSFLIFFKYFNFFSDSIRNALNYFSISMPATLLKIALPVGISFYTFKVVGYLIDIYRGEVAPEKHFGFFALFVSFFPQLIAGPIDRAGLLMPQLKTEQKFSKKTFHEGLMLMLWGFFKKIVIADRLVVYVSEVFTNYSQYNGTALFLGAFFFTIQIYCDFSGYSDIAIGAAKLMGYNLMDNFKRPYFSKSLTEFWRRWHISLSSWFKDYLYLPLGGSRVSKFRWALNIVIVFAVSGLWHGAAWTFVIWGLIHGIFLIVSRIFSGIKSKIKILFFNPLVNFMIVMIAWVFFKSESITKAFFILANMWTINAFPNWTFLVSEILLAFLLIVILFIIDLFIEKGCNLFGKFPYTRFIVYQIILLSILFLGINSSTYFIYFQF